MIKQAERIYSLLILRLMGLMVKTRSVGNIEIIGSSREWLEDYVPIEGFWNIQSNFNRQRDKSSQVLRIRN